MRASNIFLALVLLCLKFQDTLESMNASDLESLSSSVTTTTTTTTAAAKLSPTSNQETAVALAGDSTTTVIDATSTKSYSSSSANCQVSTTNNNDSASSNNPGQLILDSNNLETNDNINSRSMISNSSNNIDSSQNSLASPNTTTTMTNADSMKAPIITHDVTISNTNKKVPMVMVPVPDSQKLLAIPMSTLSELKETHLQGTMRDEQQARDLLIWENNIGTLDGCDLKFRINQLGCLELVDSDDDELISENKTTQNAIKRNKFNGKQPHQQNAISAPNQSSNKARNNIVTNNNLNTKAKTTTTTTTTTNGASSAISSQQLTIQHQNKRARVDSTESGSMRQISPGSSLLRDGPNNTRRPKSTSASSNNNVSLLALSTASANNQNNNVSKIQANNSGNLSLALIKKVEQNQNSILLNKLIPKDKLEEIKSGKGKVKTKSSSENPIDDWNTEDVKNFVDSIPGCSGYGDLFKAQQICGKSLMYLDQKDLLDVINVKLGPAVKIYNAISLLK